MTKIFFVDRYIGYSTKLFESMLNITSKKKDFDILFLGPDAKKSILFSNQVSFNPKKVWSNNHYVRKLLKYISNNKPDLVHFTFELRTFGSPWASFKFPLLLLLLRLKKQKIIINLFNIWFYREKNKWKIPSYFPSKLPKPILTVLIKIFFLIICKLCDKIIVGTNQGKICLVDYYNIDEDKINVISFGVSSLSDHLNLNAQKKFQKQFENKKIILYFGVISPRKNHQNAIKAFNEIAKKLPNHILVIAGTSTKEFKNYEENLHKLVEDLHLQKQVFFTGFIDNDEVDILFEMAESVLFLYSPMSDSTYAITMSIQHKNPIIVSDIEIFREMFSNDTAFFVDFKDLLQLSAAFLKISTDSETREVLISNITKLSRKMTWNNCAENYIKIYNSLLSKNNF
jgi:glycosyltransferase involved in cell wall biosynthesis